MPPIKNSADPILFYIHQKVTHMIVSQKFHELLQKLRIAFILFVSMCTTHVSTWLVFSIETDYLHLLHFALIICT